MAPFVVSLPGVLVLLVAPEAGGWRCFVAVALGRGLCVAFIAKGIVLLRVQGRVIPREGLDLYNHK